MHNHLLQDALIIDILSEIAQARGKPLERIKKLLLISQNPAINRKFWQLLEERLPFNNYQYVGCCKDCGLLELREGLP